MTRRGRREQRHAARAGVVAPQIVELDPVVETVAVEPPPAVAVVPHVPPAGPDPDEGIEELTVPLLRELAARRGVVLGKARTKAAIVKALRG